MKRAAWVIAILLAAIASPTQACPHGGVTTVFTARPASVPAGMSVIRGQLLTQGRLANRQRAALPETAEGPFVGVFRTAGGAWRDAVPVYARVTSCHHDLFGGRGGSDRTVFLVGRYSEASPGMPRRFGAIGWRWPQNVWQGPNGPL